MTMTNVVTIDRSRIAEALRLLRSAADALSTAYLGITEELIEHTIEKWEEGKTVNNDFSVPSSYLRDSEKRQEFRLLYLKYQCIHPTPVEMLEDEDGEFTWHYTYSIIEMADTVQQALREISLLKNSKEQRLLTLYDSTEFIFNLILENQTELVNGFKFDLNAVSYYEDSKVTLRVPVTVKLAIYFQNLIENFEAETKIK